MPPSTPSQASAGDDTQTLPERLEATRSLVVDAIAQTMDHYGVNASTALLYGLMYFHNDPITLDEMCAKMGMSKASMSTGVRKLQDNRMVHRVFRPGSRKDLYRAEEDFHKNFINFFCRRWEEEVTINGKAIAAAESQYQALLKDPDLDADTEREIERDLAKIDESKHYYRFFEKLTALRESGGLFRWLADDSPG
jgi:DNA-binding transcriptional regulator GbsR (MarR family)